MERKPLDAGMSGGAPRQGRFVELELEPLELHRAMRSIYSVPRRSAIDLERETDSLRLAPWIELIAAAGDAHVRDRLLVECAITIGCARAAALWRPIGGRWREVIARGSADDLPKLAAFEALRNRELPAGA